MTTHELKIKSEYFMDIAKGAKKAEIRYNDRNYKVGDFLVLYEIDENGVFTGNKCIVTVTHVLNNNQFLQTGYVMLSFRMQNSDDSHKNINEIKAQGIEEAVINQVLQHRLMTEREFTWQSYRDEILSYADRLKND